jgi:Uma2 family endonuclease
MNPSTIATKRRDGKPPVEDAPALFTQRFVLHDISCAAYEAILAALPERRLRHTYNKGRLEMMSPSMFHEWFKSVLGRMIEATAMELDIPIKSIGSTTFHPPEVDHGLEGDEMYFISHEAAMRGKDDYDYTTDPPPDLAVEVDVASSSRERLPIYAALGVPEIWRHDGRTLEFLRLSASGEYEPVEHSLAFPFLRAEHIDRILAQRHEKNENALVKEFVAWVVAEHKN